MKKIAVIGAGLGGLTAAALLAHYGQEVHVFEQNDQPGGKAGSISKNGYRFDTGPSSFTMPSLLAEVFGAVKLKLEDFLDVKPLTVLCKYFYSDGLEIYAYSDKKQFAQEIDENTTDSAESIFRYLSYCEEIFKYTSDLFLFKSFHEPATLLSWSAIKSFFNIKKIDSFRTMHEANTEFFRDPRVIRLFDRYATYTGSDPFKAPATQNMIQHIEYNLGGYVARGGIAAIPNALFRLAEHENVTFHFNSKVEQILHSGGTVNGIRVNGTDEPFDFVVSNADVRYTYETLLNSPQTREAKRYQDIEPSSSAVVWYWGVKEIHQTLETHNIIFSENYEEEFREIFEEKRCAADPTVYIYISSKFEIEDAPEDCENWFVMINAPAENGQNWEEEIERSRKTVIQKINQLLGCDIEKVIEFEEVLTPQRIREQTSSSFGSIYGISSNNRNAAFFRQANRCRSFKSLYFAGGSAHPGGGIPLTILSGRIAAELLLQRECGIPVQYRIPEAL